MNSGELYAFLANREGHVAFDLCYYILILLNTISYFKLACSEPSTFRGALRRIKTASYSVLAVWTTYKVWREAGDLPITIPALLGFVGLMFSDLLYSIYLHTHKRSPDDAEQ